MSKHSKGDLPVLRIEDVAQRLGISVQTVWRRVRSGQIEPVHVGSRILRFRESDVERMIQTGGEK